MTDSNRLTILRRNGYTDREAQFLCLVGDAGGYFLRRHFKQFLGTKRGRPEAVLAGKLREKRHARLYLGNGGIELYHLSPRWFYRAIDSPNSRNRRRRTPVAIHARLLTLDFVLAHPGRVFRFLDDDKTDYLVRERAVPRYGLPAIKGPWIDRFPHYTHEEATTPWPVTSFCYIDPRVFSERRFRSFLERHRSLFERLGAFRVAYVTDQRWNGRAAEPAFGHFIEAHWPRAIRCRPSIRERILEAFRAEKALRESGADPFEDVKRRPIEDVKLSLAAGQYEALYRIWTQTSDQSIYDLVAPEPHELWPNGKLTVHLIRHNYRWLYPD